MSERKFEPKTPEKFQRLVESGEEIIVAGAGQEGYIDIAGGDIVADDTDEKGTPIVRKRVDLYGNQYGRAYMLVKDKLGLMYLLKHRMEYDKKTKCFHSICTAYDVVSDKEIEDFEKICKRNGWIAPRVEPIQLMSSGKEIKDLGMLWLLESHNTKVQHRTRKLNVSKSMECPLQCENPDAYLDIFITRNYAYGRGIATDTMNRTEGILARLQSAKPIIKFVGAMVPLDMEQKFKRKEGDRSLELFDEYGDRHIDDAYCTIASVYRKLGFDVMPIINFGRAKSGKEELQRVTKLEKHIMVGDVIKDPKKNVGRHFANPLGLSDNEMI